MLHTKFRGNRPAGSSEEDFELFLPYGGHSRISDNDYIKQILYHFPASHISTNKLQHMCYSELISNNCLDATSMVAMQQKIEGLMTLAATQYFL